MFDIAEGLRKKQLCLVGTFSADLYALQQSSQKILATTIQDTVAIFMVVFNQGLQEGSLSVTERSEENAYAFFFCSGHKYLSGPAVVCNLFIVQWKH